MTIIKLLRLLHWILENEKNNEIPKVLEPQTITAIKTPQISITRCAMFQGWWYPTYNNSANNIYKTGKYGEVTPQTIQWEDAVEIPYTNQELFKI